ncbi:tRNA (adenosine(37)-N6)-threonylcarbamoyltransferase complex ATPase subunit type 1 TsaE [Desertivirga arenae]|uniref:tRNA (adenosine(37)-N6)-threonylcarbamoyltransferase complex ATPase subunit type 1 TsaE n=1 Tax=Desertivirga arenae TaxID=2810309 RepID=UPI001A95B6F0|nr:tRNA (adenosine(37)-N6)-threonylcarbamoyltransferase complex ATPase subunit type 1 TsaE [Pedobacter sp. SYSU D00823]
MEIRVSSAADLSYVASKVLDLAGQEKIFIFYGDMGAGKTTFIKNLCSVLEVSDATSSPTFSIVNEYCSPHGPIFHFDFYRLKQESEAFDLGYEDYFYSGNYCFIEWPEKVPNLLPNSFVQVEIQVTGDTERVISANKK